MKNYNNLQLQIMKSNRRRSYFSLLSLSMSGRHSRAIHIMRVKLLLARSLYYNWNWGVISSVACQSAPTTSRFMAGAYNRHCLRMNFDTSRKKNCPISSSDTTTTMTGAQDDFMIFPSDLRSVANFSTYFQCFITILHIARVCSLSARWIFISCCVVFKVLEVIISHRQSIVSSQRFAHQQSVDIAIILDPTSSLLVQTAKRCKM